MNWNLIKEEYKEINEKLLDSSLDKKDRIELQKKASQLSEIITAYDEISMLEKDLQESKRQAEKESGELKELFEQEAEEKERELSKAKQALDELLYPADNRDKRSVFIEIRAGAGGQEAALFVTDLYEMYTNYALSKNWKVSIIDFNQTEIGGYKDLTMYVKGKGVYRHFKFESGVHRVQRVPRTESAGRIHTSTVTVAVLPEVDDVDIVISPNDLRIDTFRSQGAGGQSVNTTDSAVRIVHIPSGVVVTCQDERSQIKNKAKAMKVLKARIFEEEERKREAEISKSRKQQVGTGERSEKIRTYNFPQNRVTDHRINLTLKKLDIIIQGALDDIINALIVWDIQERKKQGLEKI